VATAVSAAGAGPGLRWTVRAALVGSIAYSVVKTAAFGPLRPSLATLVAAAGAGVVVAGVCRARPIGVDRRVVGGLVGAAGVVGLAFGAHGYVERYLAADNPPDRALYALPAVSRGTATIASFPGVFVLLRGDRLEHPVALIGPREGCGAVRARLGRGPVVVARRPESAGRRRVVRCLRGVRAVGVGPFVDVFA
jgi:hypothetical protein